MGDNNNNPDAILPAPLTQTLANRRDTIPVPPSPPPTPPTPSSPPKRRRTELKRKLTMTRRTLLTLMHWNYDPTLKNDLQVIDEKLRTTAQAVVKSGEKWRRYATVLPTRSDFDGFEKMTRAALNEALETYGFPGKRICERDVDVVEEAKEEEGEVEVEVVRDNVREEHAVTRELIERSFRTRGLVVRTRSF